MNLVILEGFLGSDPELKEFGTSKKCSFRVATSESYKDKNGERKTLTEWHSVETWGMQAEFVAKYFHKGDAVLLQGSLRTDEYEKDGVKQRRTYINTDKVSFVTSKRGEAAPQQKPQHATQQPQPQQVAQQPKAQQQPLETYPINPPFEDMELPF